MGLRKTVNRKNLLLGMVGPLPRMGRVGKLPLSLPLRFCIHRLEGIIPVDGSIQALHCRQVLRRKMVRALCLGN